MKPFSSYKTIDLFSGIGGIRRGFELTGEFTNVLSAEIDKYACKTYEHLFGENPFNDVTSEEFKNRVEQTTFDVLMAGFPCQAFSIAGKKEGFRDKTRGTLFFDIADIIDRTRPKAFLLENVEGLLRHQKGETFKVIIETLIKELNYKIVGASVNPETQEIEYNPRNFLLNSKNFGVPQNRPRVYIIGFDADRYSEHLHELKFKILPQKREQKPIFRDLNELLDYQANIEYYLAEGYLETLKKHRDRHKSKGNGYGYIVVNQKSNPELISNAILATGGSGKERNLVFDPQANVTGKIVKSKKTPINSEGIRFMTPTEWGKLQGFIGYAFIDPKSKEDRFSFPSDISKGQQYKQFGNSVTIPVIETLAKEMASSLDALERSIQKKATFNVYSEVAASAF